jgi:predicted XRE-type DNA-binding protein
MKRKKEFAATGRLVKPVLAASALVVALSFAAPAWADGHEEPTKSWNVTPQPKAFPADRPQACANDGYEFFDRFQSEGETPGTYTEVIEIDGVTVTVEITVNADKTIDFDIEDGVATEVWFKSADYFLYQYEPPYDPDPIDPDDDPTNDGPVSYDTFLHDGVNSQGTYNALSHLDACIYPVYPLRAEKTAAGSYDRTVTWTLDKSVDDDSHTGYAGLEAGTSTWTVFADKTEVSDNYEVTGDITVYNDNVFDVPVTVTDALSDGTSATVSCPSDTVPAGGSLTCTYTASPADGSATLNTATITSGNPAVDGTSAEASVSFTENLIGYDSGTLSDNNEFNPNDPTVISGDTTWNYSQTFTCPANPGDYINGSYSFNVPNTATLNDNINLSDTENVDVTCILQPLSPSKTAAGTYDRTVTWTLDKSVDVASHSGNAGDTFDSTWTVTADKTEVSDNYQVAGTISISNPAAIVQAFTVSDALNDGTTAPVNCPSSTVAPGDTVTCTYAASPADGSATLNTATVSAPGNPDQAATAAVAFTENLIGYDSGTLADDRFSYSETISGDTTKTFPDTFVCSSDAADYTDGSYSFTETNTATLNGNINLSDSESVVVDCTLAALQPTKTAAGTYNRTVEWTLAKSVSPASHSGEAGDTFDSIWTVVADKTEVSDNYAVSGTISIYNPASIAQTFSVSDVLNDGSPVSVNCLSNTVAAGGTVECTYSASPADGSATLNTATVSADGNPDQTATAAVSFTENLIGYDSGTLSDPRFSYSETISGDTTKTFPETFDCSSDASVYANGSYSYTETNTVTLNGNIDLSDSASVDVACTLPALGVDKTAAGTYDRTVTWDLDKSVDINSHQGFPGDVFDSTWIVTVDKTEVSDNYKVAGDITITNPAKIDQSFTVSDALNDGTTAAVSCPSNTVAPGGTVKCTYSATPTDDSATLNTATVSATGNPDQTATAGVSFTETLFGSDSGTLADDRFSYSETVSDDTTVTFDESWTCSEDWADYTNGEYTLNELNIATLNGNINLTDSETVTVKCEAGTIDVLKFTNGVVDDSRSWEFALFIGPDGFGGSQVGNTSSTLGDADGILDFGDPIPALPLDTPYTVCELSVAAGWSSEWSIGGTTVIPYNPNADDDPPEDLGNRCFEVGAGTSYELTVGQTLTLTVDNTFPGGDPRTPGYWKNWSSCSDGGQFDKTTDDVDPLNEFVSLDEVLTSPGVTWNGFTIDSCELAVSILDQRDFDTGRKMASDAAYTLAMHLLAAQLNFGAGAETCPAAQDAALAAQTLLVDIHFDATGKYLRPKNAEYQQALDLAYTLDQYNNGLLCNP